MLKGKNLRVCSVIIQVLGEKEGIFYQTTKFVPSYTLRPPYTQSLQVLLIWLLWQENAYFAIMIYNAALLRMVILRSLFSWNEYILQGLTASRLKEHKSTHLNSYFLVFHLLIYYEYILAFARNSIAA